MIFHDKLRDGTPRWYVEGCILVYYSGPLTIEAQEVIRATYILVNHQVQRLPWVSIHAEGPDRQLVLHQGSLDACYKLPRILSSNAMQVRDLDQGGACEA